MSDPHRPKAPVITCPWCNETVTPNGPRMRLHQSQTSAFSGNTLAHFHVDCGDQLLDYCEARTKKEPALMTRKIRTPETDPNHDTIGRWFRGHDGHVYFCDSHEENHGYWMTRANTPTEHLQDTAGEWRRNVSERAIGATFHLLREQPEAKTPQLTNEQLAWLIVHVNGRDWWHRYCAAAGGDMPAGELALRRLMAQAIVLDVLEGRTPAPLVESQAPSKATEGPRP